MGETKKCSKCGGKMEQGVLIEQGQFGPFNKIKWAKEVKLLGLDIKDPRLLIAYRCNKCGYLENYAK